MTTSSAPDGMPEVPTQVFEKFLEALGGADVSVELVDRLRKTLLEDKKFTERALKEAVFPKELKP